MILYLCDGKACERPDHCSHNMTGECRHTTKPDHALHPDADVSKFVPHVGGKAGEVNLWEPTYDA